MANPQLQRYCRRSAIGAALLIAAGDSSLAQHYTSGHTDVSGSACRPISEKKDEIGCYTLVRQRLGTLPGQPLFWDLDAYQTRSAAEAAKGPRSSVVEAFGRVWLMTIAEKGWRAPGGERIAEIGPIPLQQATGFTAMYMEATFTPGGSVAPHRHSGPELWYTLSGEQCLETPAGKLVAHAGDTTIIPGFTPMSLLAVGKDIRRSLVLILHDSEQPAATYLQDWTPKGLCKG